MAITKNALSSRLQLVVQTGTDGQGNPTFRTRSYNGVRVDALDEDVYAVALVIGSLQEHPLYAIKRVDEGELTEEL
ncbi:MAG: DUF1659 domain-containing protein [Bacillota bacterium]|jgi:hypothetical protein